MLTTYDDILYGRLRLLQPKTGPRVNLDTIILADWVKLRAGHNEFLEAGCAAGAVSIMLAMKFAGVHVTGVEIQPELAGLARQNVENCGLSGRVSIIAGDIRDKALLPREHFDVLAVNPPYESEARGRVSPEPSRGTARHEMTCTPDDVAELASRVLRSRGRIFSIFTAARLGVFLSALSARRIAPKRLRFVHPDAGHDAGVFLLEGVKDGGEGLNVLPPLYIRGKDGKYTAEVLGMYDL